MLRGGGLGGGVSQLKPALRAIGRSRGVSQLYCHKSRLDGPLRVHFGPFWHGEVHFGPFRSANRTLAIPEHHLDPPECRDLGCNFLAGSFLLVWATSNRTCENRTCEN